MLMAAADTSVDDHNDNDDDGGECGGEFERRCIHDVAISKY